VDDVVVVGGIVNVVGGWGGGGCRCAAGHEKGGEGLGQQWSLPRDVGGGLPFCLDGVVVVEKKDCRGYDIHDLN